MSPRKKTTTISDALRAAILDSGTTVYAVAKGSGVSQPALSRFLSGERDLRLASADRLAAYFGMELTMPKAARR